MVILPPYAIYMQNNTIGTRELLPYGNLWMGVSNGGLNALLSFYGLGDMDWSVATYRYLYAI